MRVDAVLSELGRHRRDEDIDRNSVCVMRLVSYYVSLGCHVCDWII